MSCLSTDLIRFANFSYGLVASTHLPVEAQLQLHEKRQALDKQFCPSPGSSASLEVNGSVGWSPLTWTPGFLCVDWGISWKADL